MSPLNDVVPPLASKTTDIAAELLSKLNCGLGFLPGFGSRRQDEEEAIRYLIEEIKEETDTPPLLKAARISNARKILKAYLNQNAIIELAIEQLSKSNHAELVDDDWLSRFMDAAQHVSSKEVQLIWAALLARECNSPGTIPKTLLHTLSFIPPSLAKKFEEICSCNINPHNPEVIIDYKNPQARFHFGFDDLKELERHGLIFFGDALPFSERAAKLLICKDNNDGYVAEPLKAAEKNINIGYVLLTEDGKQLCSILSIRTPDFFDAYIQEFAKHNDLKLTEIRIKHMQDDGHITYEKINPVREE